MTMATLQRVPPADPAAVRAFLASAGRSLEAFRYFSKRPVDIVSQHLATWVLTEAGDPVAYGHLDPEADVVWLGIAVQERLCGRGLGAAMMRALLASARANGVSRVRLSVDADNARAVRLYERCGFHLVGRGDRILFFECDLTPPARAVVSSVAFGRAPVPHMIAAAAREDFGLEFSSGLPYAPDAERVFLDAPIRRLAHGYFPAPAVPFVVNLASGKPEQRERSIAHCVRGLELSHAVGAPFYSAHAGFAVEVVPEALGGRALPSMRETRDAAWTRFVSAVRDVLDRTFHLPVGLLIENHVIVPVNRRPDGTHPFLCAEADDLVRLIEEVGDRRLGLLCDTAHWKVTARTLGLDRETAVERTLAWVRCVHHSDNDGVVDDNRHLREHYWFLPFQPRVRHAVHVLETAGCTPADLHRMNALLFAEARA